MKVVHQNKELKNDISDSEMDSGLYEILKSLPKPPVNMKLSSSQKKWWYWFGYEFVKTNQVSKVDLMHLQQAAFWMDARCKALFEINKRGAKGLVQTFQSGATNVTGWVSVVEKADKHLAEVSAHFGLSIKDRKKLGSQTEDSNQLSLFDQMQKMIQG